MAEIKPNVEAFAQIKVVDVGGSGNSVVNRMVGTGVKGVELDRKSTRLNSSHIPLSRMPSSA